MPFQRIYLDHAATTPLAPEAREAMLPWLGAANASSLHADGRAAKAAVDMAREQVSTALGCLFAEAIFTGSGTEAATLALVGAALAHNGSRDTILLGAAEHHCVIHARPILERLGFNVRSVPVDREARVDLDALDSMLNDRVLITAVMHANNELGTLNPVADVARMTRRFGTLLFVDAVQTFRSPGIRTWSLDELGADLVSVSAHKLGGPKGVGALYVRAGTKLKPIIVGGGQERELRAGTENVAAIAGFGAAAARKIRPSQRHVRDVLEQALVQLGAQRTVTSSDRLDGHCHVRFEGVDAETLLISLDQLGVSAGSGAACSSGSVEPSHVLLACGYSQREAKEGLRFTLGSDTSSEIALEAAKRVGLAISNITLARC